MEAIFIIASSILAVLLIVEIWNYRSFITAANNLNILANSMQEAFKGVSVDIVMLHNTMEDISAKIELMDKVTDDLNSNDALMEIYLNLFRDALAIDPEILNRVGKFKYPTTES